MIMKGLTQSRQWTSDIILYLYSRAKVCSWVKNHNEIPVIHCFMSALEMNRWHFSLSSQFSVLTKEPSDEGIVWKYLLLVMQVELLTTDMCKTVVLQNGGLLYHLVSDSQTLFSKLLEVWKQLYNTQKPPLWDLYQKAS